MHMHMHMPVAPAHMHMHMPHRFVAADFLEAPCSVTELKAAGFAEAECTACGLERGVVAIVYAKRTREQLKAKLSVPEMVSAAGFTCEQAKRGGLLPSECHQAGYSYEDAHALGFRRRIDDWLSMDLANPYNKWS